MEYKSLSSLFHMETSLERYEKNKKEADARRGADSTFCTGITVREGELFLAVPRELSLIAEKVLRIDRRISADFKQLASIVQDNIIYSLIADEVVYSNELEGVHSTRKQIAQLIQTSAKLTLEEKRLLEATRIYLALRDATPNLPQTPEDIRKIYDRIINIEDGENLPDGQLFRANAVDVIGRQGKAIHSGVTSEADIIEYMQQMINLTQSEEMPALYSAIMSHYIFEYVHPFYDGNGRVGRYLLSLYLSFPLSTLTSLALSRVIAENKEKYYSSFSEAEDPLNHGELTFFVVSMLENIRIAQSQLVELLEQKRAYIDSIGEKMSQCSEHFELEEREEATIFQIMQQETYGLWKTLTLQKIQDYLEVSRPSARVVTQSLEDKGLVNVVKKKPLCFEASKTLLDFFAS